MAVVRKPRFARLYGWWYLCIGVAFALLALRSVLLGAPRLGVVLRCVIAAGFTVLGVMTLRSRTNSRLK